MKRVLIALLALTLLAACAAPLAPFEHEPTECELGNVYTETLPKIAIITSESEQSSAWVRALAARHSAENVLVYTHTWRNSEIAELVSEIAQVPAIRTLIIDLEFSETDDAVSLLRQQRDDIFIAYINSSRLNHFSHSNISYNAYHANLALRVNTAELFRAFPANAWALGARTFVYIYGCQDTESICWEQGCQCRESYWHRTLREISEEISFIFIAVNGNAMQCGSSTSMFMSETLPPLIAEHGTDIVFFGFDNERLFWSWRNDNMVYLPTWTPWFEPDPIAIAHELSIDHDDYLPDLIDEIRASLDGRAAFWPMSKRVLFPLAAAEYAQLWLRGEVPIDGIDSQVLQQIMVDLIAEYTGLMAHGLTLTALTENNVTYDNFYLVLLDYLKTTGR